MQSKTDRLICGTCEFWTGERQPIFSSKGIPKVDIVDTIGNCECTFSKFDGKERERNIYIIQNGRNYYRRKKRYLISKIYLFIKLLKMSD